ncbi:hypothetical protein AV530_014427 [Patagioenas fasciata monilis]|uniref:Uncharacterized protein n=1 Tax=Patagioenas fasciata monilis TaxID=372326 RepID=A0A1V4KBN5_PATFA|nr:hypothetical protein AV530_014427 [Patagioenas fasciata monilis]
MRKSFRPPRLTRPRYSGRFKSREHRCPLRGTPDRTGHPPWAAWPGCRGSSDTRILRGHTDASYGRASSPRHFAALFVWKLWKTEG